MKRKSSNCIEILSDQGKASAASNLSGYTIGIVENLVLNQEAA